MGGRARESHRLSEAEKEHLGQFANRSMEELCAEKREARNLVEEEGMVTDDKGQSSRKGENHYQEGRKLQLRGKNVKSKLRKHRETSEFGEDEPSEERRLARREPNWTRAAPAPAPPYWKKGPQYNPSEYGWTVSREKRCRETAESARIVDPSTSYPMEKGNKANRVRSRRGQGTSTRKRVLDPMFGRTAPRRGGTRSWRACPEAAWRGEKLRYHEKPGC